MPVRCAAWNHEYTAISGRAACKLCGEELDIEFMRTDAIEEVIDNIAKENERLYCRIIELQKRVKYCD